MRTRLATALSAVGIGLLVVAAWRRLAADPGPAVTAALVTVGVIGLGVAITAAAARREVAARRATRRARPGWSTWAVGADPSLRAELRREGWYVERTGGGAPRLTLAWSAEGLELWRRDEILVSLPWEDVSAVTATAGRSGTSTRPALCVTTAGDARLVLVPSARQDGALATASAAVVEGIVARVRAARDD